MRLSFWGTRGSISTPGPDKVVYGANTACVSVHSKDRILILDAGVGIVQLGDRLLAARKPKEPLRLHLLLSHLHWDHLIGLPFFMPIFFKNIELTFYGRRVDEITSATERLFTSTYSPIKGTENLGASLHYREIGETPQHIDHFRVFTRPLRHTARCLAYRIEADERAVVYASDHEAGDPNTDEGLISLCSGADVLIHDAQWTPREKADSQGKGHSSWADAVDTALRAGVATCILFHHDHRRSDRALDDIGRRAARRAGDRLEVIVARDGMLLDP